VSNSVAVSRFDRLAGVRRNRRLRNIWMTLAGVSFFIGIILVLDPLFSGSPAQLGPMAGFGALFVVSLSMTLYFHLRFLSRE
jgi:hypothetical protein